MAINKQFTLSRYIWVGEDPTDHSTDDPIYDPKFMH